MERMDSKKKIVLTFVTLALVFTSLAVNVSAQEEIDKDEAMAILGLSLIVLAICLVISLVIAILAAVWIYKDAEKRGKSGGLWAVLMIIAALILGLIGIIIIAVIWLVVRPPEMGPPVAYGPPPQPGYPPQQPYYPPQQPGYPPQQPPQQPGY